MSDEYTVTHTLYILAAFMDVSRHRYPFVILIPLFFCVFLSSFGYKPSDMVETSPTIVPVTAPSEAVELASPSVAENSCAANTCVKNLVRRPRLSENFIRVRGAPI